MYAGSRIAQTCTSGSKYYSLIDECVPLSVAGSDLFLQAYQTVKTCDGGLVKSANDVERLRYCHMITGGLTIETSDERADFSALSDINEIRGSFVFGSFKLLETLAGSLVIRRSTMMALGVFRHLASVHGQI